MSGPDLNQLMEQARAAQSRLAELQRELATRRVEGSAGGGMVVVVVSGDLRVLEVRFEDGLIEGSDRTLLALIFVTWAVGLAAGLGGTHRHNKKTRTQ